MSEFITFTGFWMSKDKNGNMMLTSNISKHAKWFMLKNTKKSKPNEPDYYLKIAKIEPKQDDSQNLNTSSTEQFNLDEVPF